MMNRFVISMCALMAALAFATCAFADERAELKARFQQRDKQLTSLKQEGVLGETWQGLVDAVNRDDLTAAARQLMEEENADRKRLYELIASDKKETPADIGVQNAIRNFAAATDREFLKAKVGPWVRRGEVVTLKREGKIGELWDGYIGVVAASDDEADRIAAVINVENIARKYTYQRQARRNDSSLDAEAQKAGAANLQRAKAGEFIKERNGDWQRKK